MEICEATRLSRKRKASARERTVVLPSRGLMPMANPKASDQARRRGVAPTRRRLRTGVMTVRLKKLAGVGREVVLGSDCTSVRIAGECGGLPWGFCGLWRAA